MRPPADDADRLARLRLIRSENVGPITFRELMKYFASAAEALDALPSLAARGGRRKIKVCAKSKAEAELAAAEAAGARYLFEGEPGYPKALAAAEDAPPILLVMGRSDLLNRPTVAIVGARNASTNGRRIARAIAAGVAAEGLAVASGMARGIDAAAHEGALDGGTVAVLAGGPDVVYPEENRFLYESIRERGAILAESPPGLVPQARHFPRRNRIISGLSLGVVVVEAAVRSGSLITARLANEQGREVMAVPGSPLDPRCRGTNDLIRRGATMVEEAGDVLATLEAMRGDALSQPESGGFGGANASAGAPVSDDARTRILEALGHTPAPVDAIIRDLNLPAQTVLTVLLELELAGRIERQPGNAVALIGEDE
ncbi:MAG: DNA-processing protein DprA [Alphaproteobacteria bacterium]|nr:DNA-processing protein DprA [Alphaproteobacteria bacterium]